MQLQAETRAHFGLWAALKSPLLIGTPLDTVQEKDLKVLKNWEMLAFNQDPVYGKPALPYKWGINPDWTWYGFKVPGSLLLYNFIFLLTN